MAHPVTGDLGQQQTPKHLVSEVLDRFGRIDILINNAGTIRRSPAVDYSEEDWTTVLEVNLSSVFRLSQLAGKSMIESDRGGKIVNIASLLSFQGGITVPAYAASKGGVAQLTKALANEWAKHRVNVNAIAPGYMVATILFEVRSKTVRRARDLKESAEMHRSIYRAIRDRNTDAARDAMRDHLMLAQKAQEEEERS